MNQQQKKVLLAQNLKKVAKKPLNLKQYLRRRSGHLVKLRKDQKKILAQQVLGELKTPEASPIPVTSNGQNNYDGLGLMYPTGTDFQRIAQQIADLVETKQKAYGDSFGKSGKIMEILYPEGIKPQQLNDSLTVVRILDKLFRIATDKNALGESPFKDIMGYALLAAVRDNKNKAQDPALKRPVLDRKGTKVKRS